MSKLPDGDFLLLIDASSYIHRAYHVLKKFTRLRDGQEIGAIIGFSWSMMKLFRLNKTSLRRRPAYGAIVLDTRGRNFRHDIFELYKANRPAYETALETQLPFLPAIAEAFNIPCIQMRGYEADDILATYATLAEEAGLCTVIASSDKDLCQLVSDQVYLYDALADRDPDQFYNPQSIMDERDVFKEWGVLPHQMIDFQAIAGDQVDNIPGVKGIGPKIAAKLIEKFDDVDNMLAEGEWGAEGFPTPRIHRLVMDAAAEIRLSYRLAELDRHLDVPLRLEQLRLKLADAYTLKAFFREIDSPQLERRVDF